MAEKPIRTLQSFASCGFVALVEFRMQKNDPLKWLDKETKKPREMDKLTVAVELIETGEPVLLEIMPERGAVDGAKVEPWPYKRGDLIVITARSVIEEKGKLGVRVKEHSLFIPAK